MSIVDPGCKMVYTYIQTRWTIILDYTKEGFYPSFPRITVGILLSLLRQISAVVVVQELNRRTLRT